MSVTTVAQVLETRLRELGVMRIYGLTLGGLSHVEVADPDIAVLLADADGRIGHHDGSGRLGAALLDGSILHLSSKPGGTAVPQRVTTAEELLDALAEPPGMEIPGTMALHLDLDLDAPIDDGSGADREVPKSPVVTLDPAMAALRIVLLVGPGVVRSSMLVELRELARRAGWGVINTWGARGVERWDSPFNFATVGLQERDLEFSGISEADVVIASGIDPDELDLGTLGPKLVQVVPPRQLPALVHGWQPSRQPPTRAPHHEVVSRVLTPLYESESVPLSGPRAALHLSGAVPSGGLVVADPGAAGFWIARSYPTSTPESLCVPATRTPGFAAAAALICALEGRPCIAVTDQPVDQPEGDDEVLDAETAAVLELAESLDLPVALQLWGQHGALSDTNGHVELIRSNLRSQSVVLSDVPVATNDFEGIAAVLGETVAWTVRP